MSLVLSVIFFAPCDTSIFIPRPQVTQITRVRNVSFHNLTLVVWENITVTHWLSNGSDKWEYHSKLLSEPIIGAEYHMTVTDKETTQHSTPKVSRNVEQGIWDGLVDVREPGNATYPVEYNHTDNLFTYHPGEFDLAWEMKGDKALHIH
ncbi:MAG: hypothetical protein QW840_03545, partial [Candidatus Bathyarchaeia archaeon]